MSELVLITGTSSGIGLSAAIEAAAAGHRVVATMRNIDKRELLVQTAKERGVRVDVEQLDVTSDTATATIRELILKYGPFYGLVNNAGIAIAGVFEEQSERDIRDQFETNVFGVMTATRAVLPQMRAARRGRIVNISSVSGRVAFAALSIYAASKHAIEGFSESLRWEVEPFGVEVCVVEPGTFKTPIFFANQRRAADIDAKGAYAEINAAIEKMVLDVAEKAPPPDAVGKAVARLLTASAPPFRTVVGTDARTLVTLRRMIPDRLFASGLRRFMGLPRPR